MTKKCFVLCSLMLGLIAQLGAVNFIGYISRTKSVIEPYSKTAFGAALYHESFYDQTAGVGIIDFYDGTTPMDVYEIGANAFLGKTDLSALCIPKSVTSVDASAFSGCTLDSMCSMNMTPPTLTGELPESLQKIKVPGEAVNAYKNAAGWSDYATKIEAIPEVQSSDDYVFLGYSVETSYEVKTQMGITMTIQVRGMATIFCKWTAKNLFLSDDDAKIPDTLASELTLFNQNPTLTKNITIGRQFYRNGTRHTLCLPFDVTKGMMDTCALGGFTSLQTFDGAEVEHPGKSDEVLVIKVKDVNTTIDADAVLLEAGKPYILIWPNDGQTITNPVFGDVRISTATAATDETQDVNMVGVFSRTYMNKEDYYHLFISADGSFSWPNKTNYMRGFRAYFLIKQASQSPIRQGMPTQLRQISTTPTTIERVSTSAPYTKIVRNGQIRIVRDNVEYTILGGQLR